MIGNGALRYDFKPKMIVFDKDGTLGDCTPSMHNWCDRMTSRIRQEYLNKKKSSSSSYQTSSCKHDINIDKIIANFHTAIGWNSANQSLEPSAPLSAGTWEEILHLTSRTLIDSNVFDNDIAEKVIYWHDTLGNIHGNDKPLIDDLPGLMEFFREAGIIVAICTSDDRKSTDQVMKAWNLDGMIDHSICGDEVTEPKPSSQPLDILCQRANVRPEDCIVVGDTKNDTGMGRNSNAGLVVGVLSGSGTKEHLLETGADIVLEDVGDLPIFLMGENLIGSSPVVRSIEINPIDIGSDMVQTTRVNSC